MSLYFKTKKKTGDLAIVGVVPELTNSAPHNLGKTAFVGFNNDSARSDHIHKFPTLKELNAANDSEVVHNYGNETIIGEKVFNNVIYASTPSYISTNNEVATADFVVNRINFVSSNVIELSESNYVHIQNINESIDGKKTFLKPIKFSNGIEVTTGDILCSNSTLSVNSIEVSPNTNLDGTIKSILQTKMGITDQARVGVGASANDMGFLEIATAKNGSEPIYVRQYSGTNFQTPVHELSLLDSEGNTSIPGDLSVSGDLIISGLATFETAYIPIKVVKITSNKTLSKTDWNTLQVVTGSASITLPSGSSYNGMNVYIKNLYTNDITIKSQTGTIDTFGNISLGRYECLHVISDGTDWYSMDTSARFQ